jgi:Fe-S oxidoreductase
MPAFAEETFRDWFARRVDAPTASNGSERPHVILFPDTFNNFFKVETAKAAVEVLEHAGYQVMVPEQTLCCGRPLYDYGFLDLAKKLLIQLVSAFRDEVRAGVKIVGLEPSCVAAFRDELPNMLPHDQDARRLSASVLTLAEFLMEHVEDYEPPKLDRKALIHGHCHHHSIMGLEPEQILLDRMGVEHELINSGCCGVAGSFGFEEGHYDVSMKCGEYALLPEVRAASDDTLIIADGFSCREQVQHATRRHGLHLAEVLHLALHPERAPKAYPERLYVRQMRSPNGTADVPSEDEQAAWLKTSSSFLSTFFKDR